MKQIQITKTGKVDALKIYETAIPQPGAGEVLIKVKAAGINFAEILARQGLYPDAPKIPFVPGYEVSGVIEKVGEDVKDCLIGKTVVAFTFFNGYSEYVAVPVTHMYAKPDAISYEQAAAIPVNYMTAYMLLIAMGSLKEGETVLIHNAGGGVGLAAIDLARKCGARIIGTSSKGKHGFLLAHGVDHVVDYRNGDWTATILDLTDGQGVDLVLDPVGGNHWRKSYKVLNDIGRLGLYGVSCATCSGPTAKLRLLKAALLMPIFHPVNLINSNKGVFGVNLGHLWDEHAKFRAWMEMVLAGTGEGWVRPHVDKVFRLEDVADAHRYIEARKNIGKVILVPG